MALAGARDPARPDSGCVENIPAGERRKSYRELLGELEAVAMRLDAAADRGEPADLGVVADALDAVGRDLVVDPDVMLRRLASRVRHCLGAMSDLAHAHRGSALDLAQELHNVGATLRGRQGP